MTEIANRSPLGDRMNYAKALAEASLLPASYRKQPANVLLAMEYGDALGLSPIAAIQGVHVIDGKPTASAQLIGALVRKAGHRLRVIVSEDRTAAKATIVRADDPEFEFVSVWTLDRAQSAGLLGKGTWKAYPENLLKARAITEVARDACPEVLSGVAYTPEELGHDDLDRPSTGPSAGWTAAGEKVEIRPRPIEVEVIDVVEDKVAPVKVPANVRGPLANTWGREDATAEQRRYLGRLVREAGFENTDAFLASDDARAILDGRPSDPLWKGHASQLIDALTDYLAEIPADEPIDEQEAGENYEAGR